MPPYPLPSLGVDFHKTRSYDISTQSLGLISQSGHDSRVVKVTDSWLVCHEFEFNTAEDSPCRRGRCTLSTSRLKIPPDDVVSKLGEEDSSSGIVLVT
ncbi:hypothetical protein TNCV_2542231 [Trichonephila clavipes]|nr:hypothetical protein TNCV_2542231 [Trichonephila clavipes]